VIEYIPTDWRTALGDTLAEPWFDVLERDVAAERADPTVAIYPSEAQVFRALELTPIDEVRAVILGQDPYFTEGLATGLAFSIPEGSKRPRSLQNIFRAREFDLRLPLPSSGSLGRWAENGVLLLNTALTVQQGIANSHRRIWRPFTDAVIRVVASQERPVSFLLWGRQAGLVQRRVRIGAPHFVVESMHPACRRPGFITSKPFSKATDGLCALGQSRIDWSLPGDPPIVESGDQICESTAEQGS
jgi:uracil-DNA glycosylase